MSLALGALFGMGAQQLGAAQAPPKEIPKATKLCSPDEAKWWEALRTAAQEAVAAHERKVEAEATASAKRINLDERKLAKMDADITVTRQRYLDLLREGLVKSYRPPIPDGRPIILTKVKAKFTEEARQKKINGSNILQIMFRADGFVSDIKIVRGLGSGLEERSIDSAKQILFIPMVKDGVFVSIRSNIEFTFNVY